MLKLGRYCSPKKPNRATLSLKSKLPHGLQHYFTPFVGLKVLIYKMGVRICFRAFKNTPAFMGLSPQIIAPPPKSFPELEKKSPLAG